MTETQSEGRELRKREFVGNLVHRKHQDDADTTGLQLLEQECAQAMSRWQPWLDKH